MKRILLSIALVLTIIYLGVAFTSFKRKPAGTVCLGLELVLKDTLQGDFITLKEVTKILDRKGINPVGKKMEEIHPSVLEHELAEHPLIDRVECYKTPANGICLEVSQRIPVLRVMNSAGEDYYVDNKGDVMPSNARTVARTVVATGHISKAYATGPLYHFAGYLQNHPFWNAQVEQINICRNQTVELVPRVGNHFISLGKLDDFESKLKRLKAFYERGLNKVGWDKYSRISVEFGNQVICTKK